MGFLLLTLCAPQATMLFAELTYTLATEEAERIGVDHVARMTATGSGENSTGKGGCGGFLRSRGTVWPPLLTLGLTPQWPST